MNKDLRKDLLFILCEECGEVVQGISKCERFGYENRHRSDFTNAEKVGLEMADLIAVYEMLVDEGVFPKVEDDVMRERIANKKEKVLRLFKDF